MQALQYLVDLGPSVMMPIIFTVFALCLGVKFGKAIRSGLLIGIGFIGLNRCRLAGGISNSIWFYSWSFNNTFRNNS